MVFIIVWNMCPADNPSPLGTEVRVDKADNPVLIFDISFLRELTRTQVGRIGAWDRASHWISATSDNSTSRRER